MLSNRGFIPGDPLTRNFCGRAEVIDRWGPAVELVEGAGAPCKGYEFREEDGERYHLYVTELFQRVHQRKLVRKVLPFHFERGLAVEASGGSVNWVAFAMSRCFPRHKKSPFAPLSEYAAMDVPVPWNYNKVLPEPERRIAQPLAAPVLVRTRTPTMLYVNEADSPLCLHSIVNCALLVRSDYILSVHGCPNRLIQKKKEMNAQTSSIELRQQFYQHLGE